jgi:hypothetical protein
MELVVQFPVVGILRSRDFQLKTVISAAFDLHQGFI